MCILDPYQYSDITGSRLSILPYSGCEICLTNGRNGGDELAQLELVENGGLARRVQSEHHDAHVLRSSNKNRNINRCC